MIHYFKASNFFSAKDEVAVDFRATKAKSNEHGFIESQVIKETYLSKIITVFGPNASGKTNVLRILSFISWLMSRSFFRDSDDYLPYIMHLGIGRDPNSNIEVLFEIKNELYKYLIKLVDADYIAFEQLSEFNKDTKQFNILYKREKAKKEELYQISDLGFSLHLPDDAANRDNTPLLRIAAQYGHQRSKSIVSYWDGIQNATNIDIVDGYREETSLVDDIFKASKQLYNNKNLHKSIVGLFNRMDVGVSDIEITEDKQVRKLDGLPQEKEFTMYRTTFHRISKNGKNKLHLPVFFESTGVKSLLCNLTKVMSCFESDTPSIVVLDEIDSGIHPDLLPVFFDLFRDEATNPFHHQLLVTLHSNQVMDELEKNQIYFTKMNDLKTEIYPLDSINKVRKDISFSASYRAGRFGALPELE